MNIDAQSDFDNTLEEPAEDYTILPETYHNHYDIHKICY